MKKIGHGTTVEVMSLEKSWEGHRGCSDYVAAFPVSRMELHEKNNNSDAQRVFSLKSTMSWGAHFFHSFHIVLKILAKIKVGYELERK